MKTLHVVVDVRSSDKSFPYERFVQDISSCLKSLSWLSEIVGRSSHTITFHEPTQGSIDEHEFYSARFAAVLSVSKKKMESVQQLASWICEMIDLDLQKNCLVEAEIYEIDFS